MGIFDILKQPKSPLSTLEAAQTQARLDLAQAVENLDAARGKEKASLLADDETIALAAVRLVEMEEMRLRRAQAAIDAIGERMEQARSREAEAQRKADYKVAKKASEEAAAELREYDDIAMRMVAILAKLASADLAVQNVNANLPEGAEPIVRPEDIACGALPRKVVEDVELIEWFAPGEQVSLSEEDAARVVDLNDGTGRLPPAPRSRGQYVVRMVDMIVRKRVRTKQSYLPSTLNSARQLRIPGATRLSCSTGVAVWSGWTDPERIVAEAAKVPELIRAAKVPPRDEREALSHILD